MTTEVDTTTKPGELAPVSDEAQAAIDAMKGEIDSSSLQLPAIKLTAELTREVKDGLVDEGHFFNTITGEDYGTEVKFLVAAFYKGRFFSDDDGRGYPASALVAPDWWPEEYAGQAFVDIPDAEEQWKRAVNEKKQEWGKGPPIQTTYNFVGYVNDDLSLPARLTLKSANTPTARKMQTVLATGRAFWDRVFTLKAVPASQGRYSFFRAEATLSGVPSSEAQQAAANLAVEFRNRGIAEESAPEEAESKPRGRARKRDDALDVD